MTRHRRLNFALLIAVGLSTASAATAAIVHLVDGSSVEGQLVRTSDGWEITRPDGTVTDIPTDKVASIDPGGPASSATAAMDRLSSLRRVVDHMSDIAQIVERYQSFIQQNTDPAALDQANQDLAQWQQRQDDGLVKLGDKWITPQERDHRRQLAQTEAQAARELIRQNRYADATPLLEQALTDDPQSSTALFLQSVMLFNQGEFSESRKALQTLNQILPDNFAVLNNLAVIAWKENSSVVAMGYYDQAMTAAPQNRQVLDNVAEALNALPPQSQQAPVSRRAVILFHDQDTHLQKTQATAGQYRWGATWVTAKQLADLTAQQAKIKQKVDALAKEFDDVQQSINEVDNETAQNLQEMHRMETTSSAMDRNGNVIMLPLPQAYDDLKDDNLRLADQRQKYVARQDQLRAAVKAAQQELSVPPFTGLQRFMGIEAAPMPKDVLPATNPASAP